MISFSHITKLFLFFFLTLLLPACSNDVNYEPPEGNSEPAITHYSFGKMIINNQEYAGDLMISQGRKVSTWLFDNNTHVIEQEDLKRNITDGIKLLIIGTGYSGQAVLSEKAVRFVEYLKTKGIQVHISSSSEGVKFFNSSPKEGMLAFFHLNC